MSTVNYLVKEEEENKNTIDNTNNKTTPNEKSSINFVFLLWLGQTKDGCWQKLSE